jgi:maltose alpha-D-glucosyltransferase/alpha-amylase
MNSDPLWYKNAVFYEIYVRAYYDANADGNGDLPGLMSKLDYLEKLGVDCLWLLPIYPSPLLDGGYDIADYYGIHPDYGNLEDFKRLLDAAHDRDMRVITDLVLNHTSDQHPWFQEARADRNSPYRDYYVWSDTDKKYDKARIIFIDTEHSNWTWDEIAGQYYFHRFYASQPDLNYDNPAVQEEMMEIISYWLDLGVDGFRADAVPYLFEREGTNCENLSETHIFLKKLRRFIDENYPGRVLLSEANQWPKDVRPYFGEGDEFQMAFHFPVMPRIFMALRQGDVTPITWILSETPPIPPQCQWVTFLRNHDELTLEMVTPEEREWMWQEYAPDPRMRLNLGIRRRLAPLLNNDRRLIELANSLLFTLPGSPIVYYGDEIGMGDNIYLPDRDGVRTPMQWNSGVNAGFSDAPENALYSPVISGPEYGPEAVNVHDQEKDPASLLNTIHRMISVRKSHQAFGWGEFAWAPGDNKAIAAYLRTYQGQVLFIANNLSGQPQEIRLSMPGALLEGSLVDIFTGERLRDLKDGTLQLHLEPYEYRWMKFQGIGEIDHG